MSAAPPGSPPSPFHTLFGHVKEHVLDGNKESNEGEIENIWTLCSKITTSTSELASQISKKITLVDHFQILVEGGRCANRILASIRWFVSNIPLLGPMLAGGDFRRTEGVYEEALTSVIHATNKSNSEFVSAKEIRCKWDGEIKKFILQIDGDENKTLVINDLNELSVCTLLASLAIENFPGTNLNLLGLRAPKISISNCPNLKSIDAHGGANNIIIIAGCAELEAVTGGEKLNSFEAENCPKLITLDFSESRSLGLSKINLTNSGTNAAPEIKLHPWARSTEDIFNTGRDDTERPNEWKDLNDEMQNPFD
ncbi:MAG: hypothetical protein LBF26_00850 [Puniceicoccales bacterium]|jgi:hypothetical protein|nr:hypothetical protein [Puniceicoccales bacterium]